MTLSYVSYNPEKVNKSLVVKRNELIEGRYELCSMAQKVLATLISMVNPQGDAEEASKAFRLDREDIINILGIKRKNYPRTINKVADQLATVVVLIREANEGISRVNMFFKSTYFQKDDYIIFKFHPDLMPYIVDFQKNFTQYQLSQIKSLKSEYSIRMYEVMRRRHPIKVNRPQTTCILDLEEIRFLCGVEQDKYKQASGLRQKVVDVAVKEVTEKTDLFLQYELVKSGKKIKGFKFTIRHNKQKPSDVVAQEPALIEQNLVAELEPQTPVKTIISENFNPSEFLIRTLHEEYHIPIDYIKKQVSFFIVYYLDTQECRESWQKVFLKWVLREWEGSDHVVKESIDRFKPSRELLNKIKFELGLDIESIHEFYIDFAEYWAARGEKHNDWETRFYNYIFRQLKQVQANAYGSE